MDFNYGALLAPLFDTVGHKKKLLRPTCTRVQDFLSLVADAAACAPSPLPHRRFQPLKRCKTIVRFTNPGVADRSRLTISLPILFS